MAPIDKTFPAQSAGLIRALVLRARWRIAIGTTIICALCLASPIWCQTEKSPTDLVYVWYPRSVDIPADPHSKDAIILRALLGLAKTEKYKVSAGDNLDYIIRQKFFVSEKQRNAYLLYFRAIRFLNSSLAADSLLRPGSELVIPSGPQYGATEIGREKLPADVARKTFLRMSAKAYFGPGNQYKARTDELTNKVVRSLGFLVAKSSNQLSQMKASDVVAQVQKRGIVPPINLDKYPESHLPQAQPMHLLSDGSLRNQQLIADLVSAETEGRLLPGSLPEDRSVLVDCPQCTSCSALLKLPVNADFSQARVLVEDTGIDSQVVNVGNNLIYIPQGSDGTDISIEHHGTFVYSEIARSGHGPIPDNQVFVAKVGSVTAGGVGFEVEDIINGLKKFSSTMKAAGVKSRTWVVNLSAEGEPAPDTQPPPLLLPDPNLLVVAAAGNGGSGVAPATEAFDRLSNGNSNLLIVGALSKSGDLATYSNHHPSNVQILATGDCTCGTPGQLNGTSQAAPLVAVAAAAVASARPEWYPSEVMWRLLSTSDRPPSLHNMSLSGPVNLASALKHGIILRINGGAAAGMIELVGSQIQFDQEWEHGIEASTSGIDKGFVLLRLFDPTSIGSTLCFSAMRWQIFDRQPVCVSAEATVTLTTGTTTQSFPASKVKDIILPMNTDRFDLLPVISAIQP